MYTIICLFELKIVRKNKVKRYKLNKLYTFKDYSLAIVIYYITIFLMARLYIATELQLPVAKNHRKF